MRKMIIFQLKKKYLQRQTLLKMAIVFIVIGVLVFVDMLIPLFISPDTITISLNKSTLEYQPYFVSSEKIHFEASETYEHVLVYNHNWILRSRNGISVELKDELTSIVNKAMALKEGNYVETIEVEVSNVQTDDFSLHLILLTIIYFACLSKTSALVQSLIEEKLNGTINMYLVTLKSWKHMIGKILVGWGSMAVDVCYGVICFLLWSVVRLAVDNGKNLQKLLVENVSLEGTNTMVQIDELLVFVGLLLLGIFTIQILIMIFVAKIKSVDEIGNNLIPIHLVLMGNYYLCFYLFDLGLLDTTIVQLMSYLPIINTILLPMRILKGDIGIIQTVLFVISNFIWLSLLVVKGQKSYKYRLLDIKKLRHFNLRS